MKKTIQVKQSGAKLLHYGSLVADWLSGNRHEVHGFCLRKCAASYSTWAVNCHYNANVVKHGNYSLQHVIGIYRLWPVNCAVQYQGNTD